MVFSEAFLTCWRQDGEEEEQDRIDGAKMTRRCDKMATKSAKGLFQKIGCCMCMYGWMGEWMHGCMSVGEIMYVLALHFMFLRTCRILANVNHTGQKFCAHRPLAPAGVNATECHSFANEDSEGRKP